uniref:Protein kinase domain-containing protein n=1 Tax=Strigamia maritima TaxID=126957 RepID=T1JIG0_STRMM
MAEEVNSSIEVINGIITELTRRQTDIIWLGPEEIISKKMLTSIQDVINVYTEILRKRKATLRFLQKPLVAGGGGDSTARKRKKTTVEDIETLHQMKVELEDRISENVSDLNKLIQVEEDFFNNHISKIEVLTKTRCECFFDIRRVTRSSHLSDLTTAYSDLENVVKDIYECQGTETFDVQSLPASAQPSLRKYKNPPSKWDETDFLVPLIDCGQDSLLPVEMYSEAFCIFNDCIKAGRFLYLFLKALLIGLLKDRQVNRAHRYRRERERDRVMKATDIFVQEIVFKESLPKVSLSCKHGTYPSFLLFFDGWILFVFGAVMPSRTIVRSLIRPIDLTADDAAADVAVFLFALEKSFQCLDNYYAAEDHPNVNLPIIMGAEDKITDRRPKKDYMKNSKSHMEKLPIFESAKFEGHDVVIKFTKTYNKAAHDLLADEGLAPRVRYYKDNKTFHTVVYDFVNGVTFEEEQAKKIQEKLKEAIAHLHRHDFVFGDLRGPNVLVDKNEEIKLIDFDWCGKVNEATYPNVNLVHGWHSEVKYGVVLKKEHDTHMLKKLCPDIEFADPEISI